MSTGEPRGDAEKRASAPAPSGKRPLAERVDHNKIHSGRGLGLQRTEWGLLAAILIVVVATALLDSQHHYWNNPQLSAINILRQAVMLGIFSLGAAVVIIVGGIDLSAGSVIAFSGTVCASLLLWLAPEELAARTPVGYATIALAIGGTLLVGFLIGSLHAWLITVVGLPPFVATLATLVGLRSFGRILVEQASGTTQIPINDERFRYLAGSLWIPAVLFAGLALLMWLLLSRTVVGRHIYAVGGNEQAARLSGIRTDRVKWLAYCISAVLASLAGVLYVSDLSIANPQNLARGYELNAIAAAVVGGCGLQGGVGTIPGVVLGVVFLRTVIDGVAKIIKSNADMYEGIVVGSVVVLAVAVNHLRQAGRRGTRFFSGGLGAVTIVNLSLLAGASAMLLGGNALAGTLNVSSSTLGAAAGAAALALLFAVRVVEGRRSVRP